MPMTIAQILDEIDWTLTKTALAPRLRAERLQELATALWRLAFPSTAIECIHSLPPEEVANAWKPIRAAISKYKAAAKIFRVADWPGTGEDLSTL